MYIGRFAPTPSGGLHFGSLVAALASFIDAKRHTGKWLVRIEDLDFPRNKPNADTQILQQLEDYQLFWDATPSYQSKNLAIYMDILQTLQAKNLIYMCNCSRKDLANKIYRGTCRTKKLDARQEGAWRLQLDLTKKINWQDGVLAKVEWRLADLGDPILLRKDKIIAYQLAVVVDDHYAKINNVVRGADLLSSTAWQICLYQKLGWDLPKFSHIPLVMGADGKKLSKQNLAQAITKADKIQTTAQALEFLGLKLPSEFYQAEKLIIDQTQLLAYAIENLAITKF